MKKDFFNTPITALIVLIASLFLFACANIVPPSGGVKDNQKPQILSAEPANYSTLFTSNKIKLALDEFYNLDNPAQQIIISPPVLQQPDYIIAGKKLTIKFNASLLPNTTYNINFGNSIKDFNEGNVQDSFKYVFSTGSEIDSGMITGRVLNASDNIVQEGFSILLYKDLSDSVVFKNKPYYTGKTNKAGFFTITNIQNGTYKIIALKDNDFDYLFNPESETIAFADTFITINDSSCRKDLTLFSFKELATKTVLLDVTNPRLGMIKFIYNKPIVNFRFDADIYNKNDVAILNPTKDTISYYYSDYTRKNTTFFITTNNTIKDTITKELFYIKESELPNNNINILNEVSFQKGMNKQSDFQDIYKPYTIMLSRPFSIVDSNKIEVLEDTSSTLVNFSYNQNPKDKRSLAFFYNWKPGMQYQIVLKDGAIQDLFGSKNEDLKQSFKTASMIEYGNIILHNSIEKDKPYLLQIWNEKGQNIYQNYISSLDKNKTTTIPNLMSGNYRIVVVEDNNLNKKWDSGRYILHQQPEKIYSFGDKIFLKPGWDLDIDIKL